jgi:hypothetical protein
MQETNLSGQTCAPSFGWIFNDVLLFLHLAFASQKCCPMWRCVLIQIVRFL